MQNENQEAGGRRVGTVGDVERQSGRREEVGEKRGEAEGEGKGREVERQRGRGQKEREEAWRRRGGEAERQRRAKRWKGAEEEGTIGEEQRRREGAPSYLIF
jgi:hypothetical protein